MTFRKKITEKSLSFEEMIQGGYIYVDKTDYLQKIIGLITKEKREYLIKEIEKRMEPGDKPTYNYDDLGDKELYYFMQGPSCFGKSLTLSALNYFYQGRGDLFQGLKISEFMKANNISWKQVQHPVIFIDFKDITCSSFDEMKRTWIEKLLEIAELNNVNIPANDPDEQIVELINKLYEKTGKRVVVLIDEYDKPIVENLGKGKEYFKVALENQSLLRDFYSIFKSQDILSNLELLFITGINQFSITSVFSNLNSLLYVDNIPQFTGIIGYTEEELKYYFNDYVNDYAVQENIILEEAYAEIRKKYDGYRFWKTDIRLYNPYSIAKALNNLGLDNYWFKTCTPDYLVNLMKDQNFNILEYKSFYFNEYYLKLLEIENIQLLPLLFQAGYLTVKDWKSDTSIMIDFPNEEVETGFNIQFNEPMTNH